MNVEALENLKKAIMTYNNGLAVNSAKGAIEQKKSY